MLLGPSLQQQQTVMAPSSLPLLAKRDGMERKKEGKATPLVDSGVLPPAAAMVEVRVTTKRQRDRR